MNTFKDVFDHKIQLMIMWSTTIRETVTESYLTWAAKHMLSQRIRLENQKGTIKQQAREIHDLQKEVRRLENEIDDIQIHNEFGNNG